MRYLLILLLLFSAQMLWAHPNTWTEKVTGITFIYIPPGCFQMGCKAKNKNCYFDEKPERKVCIKRGFWISKTEITVSQWEKFVKETGYTPKKKDLWGCEDTAKPMFKQGKDHPVVCVNWYDAHAFAEWLSKKIKRKVRLPTEEEWEYACKLGKSDEAINDNANFWSGFSGRSERDGYRETGPVCSFKPNSIGICDLIGNAWEWTDSWYGLPNLPTPKERRVVKGGGWESKKKVLRCSARRGLSPERNYDSVGFRIVVLP